MTEYSLLELKKQFNDNNISMCKHIVQYMLHHNIKDSFSFSQGPDEKEKNFIKFLVAQTPKAKCWFANICMISINILHVPLIDDITHEFLQETQDDF